FAVDVPRNTTGNFNFHLRSIDAAIRLPWPMIFLTLSLRANLDTRVQLFINLHFELQLEVTIPLFAAQTRVGATFGGRTNDRPIVDLVGGGAILLHPTRQILAVEQFDP